MNQSKDIVVKDWYWGTSYIAYYHHYDWNFEVANKADDPSDQTIWWKKISMAFFISIWIQLQMGSFNNYVDIQKVQALRSWETHHSDLGKKSLL